MSDKIITVIFFLFLFIDLSGVQAEESSCGDSLGEQRAKWLALAEDPSTPCMAKDELWLSIRQCFAGSGSWMPSMREVGNCWLKKDQNSKALDFYSKITSKFDKHLCTKEGVSCRLLAEQEARKINCGVDWIAASEEETRADFVAALSENAAKADKRWHLRPFVGEKLASKKVVSGKGAASVKCPSQAFEVLDSIRGQSEAIKAAFLANKPVVVALWKSDEKNRNWPIVDHYTHLWIDVCPIEIGRLKGFFVALEPLTKADVQIDRMWCPEIDSAN